MGDSKVHRGRELSARPRLSSFPHAKPHLSTLSSASEDTRDRPILDVEREVQFWSLPLAFHGKTTLMKIYEIRVLRSSSHTKHLLRRARRYGRKNMGVVRWITSLIMMDS